MRVVNLFVIVVVSLSKDMKGGSAATNNNGNGFFDIFST